jgi:prephenate dehydratase
LKDVAFQGEPGAYSHIACRELLGSGATALPCRTFADTFEAVARGRARFALVPAENSTAGTVHEAFDLLVRCDLRIVAEHYLAVRHCLLAPAGTRLGDVRRVYSHPQALAQCDRFVARLGARPCFVFDTAGSARLVGRSRAAGSAAIASDLAGRIHGLRVLKRDVQDQPNNVTRFLLLTRSETTAPEKLRQSRGRHRKTTLVFETPHRPGALARALGAFAGNGLNLTKIESRPVPNRPFEYSFTVDVIGDNSPSRLDAALSRLRRTATTVRVLGTYVPGVAPRP